MSSAIASTQQYMKQLVHQSGGNTTPRTEATSNAERTSNSLVANLGAPSNNNIGSSTREK